MHTKEYQRAWRERRKAAGLPYLGTKMSKEWYREYSKHYLQRPEVKAKIKERTKQRMRNPIERVKCLCRRTLNSAIKSGNITRQPCEICGEKAHAHHDDYSKPLEVRWLCASHHRKLHLIERRQLRVREEKQQ